MILDAAAAPEFSRRLVDWFARNGRALPWRDRYDAYSVWISEIMLQQTQMERGVEYFNRWMRLFPDIRSVAQASESAILKAWEGLGYYSRARNLHRAAQCLMERHQGAFPRDVAHIRALPGIGEYTAGAIASIAFNQDVPAVDANVERVFSRLLDIDTPIVNKTVRSYIRDMTLLAMPKGQARQYNQAIMELGALVCGKRPDCDACPVRRFCEARRLGVAEQRPVPPARPGKILVEVATGVLAHQGGLLVQKRPPAGVWANFWEFPGGTVEKGETPEQALFREFEEETEFRVRIVEKIGVVRFNYTRYSATMHGYLVELETPFSGFPKPVLHAATEYAWPRLEELERYVFPSGHRKLIQLLHQDPRFLRLKTPRS